MASLWRKQFWATLWLALRRSKSDKRARRLAFVTAFGLTCLLSICAFEVYLLYLSGRWTAPLYGVLFAAAGLALVLVRGSHRRQAKAFRDSLTGRASHSQQISDEIPTTTRTYLEQRALITASLVSRAASEIYLQYNEVPAGLELITRQTQNQILRRSGLWEKLEPAEVDLVHAADGLWTVEQQNQFPIWCERLRLLRWVLRIDDELTPLAHFPKPDLSLTRGMRGKDALLVQRGRTLRSWDVRLERDISSEYVARILAELKTRGLFNGGDAELESWARDLRDKFQGPSADYIAGVKTIGELDDEALKLLGATATSRYHYAAYLVDQLSSDTPISFATWSWPVLVA